MKSSEPGKSKGNSKLPDANHDESLDDFITRKWGKQGTAERQAFDAEYEEFKLGWILQEARGRCGLTQDELARRAGTNKSYISRIERDLKDPRISTLQRIVREGFGGELEITIRFPE